MDLCVLAFVVSIAGAATHAAEAFNALGNLLGKMSGTAVAASMWKGK